MREIYRAGFEDGGGHVAGTTGGLQGLRATPG